VPGVRVFLPSAITNIVGGNKDVQLRVILSPPSQTIFQPTKSISPGSAGRQNQGGPGMKRHIVKALAVTAAVMFMSITVLELYAHARAGGGRSSGSRGSRSYSSPASPSSQPSQPRQQYAPAPGPVQQQTGGGFMRGMAGGIMGGMLGSMLFSSVAGAGGAAGTATGSGIGLFEIILLAGAGYLVYRYIKKKRAAGSSASMR
jgi:hypothetical protein